MNADELWDKVKATYGQLNSYADTGTFSSESSPIATTEFKTYFQRPGKFRSDWLQHIPGANCDHEQSCAVWTDGFKFNSRIHTIIQEQATITEMLSTVPGCPYEAYLTLMDLLTPGWLDSPDDQNVTIDFQFQSEEIVDNKDCYRILGQSTDGAIEVQLWIEQSTYLVRRLSQRIVWPDTLRDHMSQMMESEQFLSSVMSSMGKSSLDEGVIKQIFSATTKHISSGEFQTHCTFKDIWTNTQMDDSNFSVE